MSFLSPCRYANELHEVPLSGRGVDCHLMSHPEPVVCGVLDESPWARAVRVAGWVTLRQRCVGCWMSHPEAEVWGTGSVTLSGPGWVTLTKSSVTCWMSSLSQSCVGCWMSYPEPELCGVLNELPWAGAVRGAGWVTLSKSCVGCYMSYPEPELCGVLDELPRARAVWGAGWVTLSRSCAGCWNVWLVLQFLTFSYKGSFPFEHL